MADLFIGIDPGVSGAVALYCPATGFLDVFDVPHYLVSVGGRKRRRVDIPSLIANLGDTGDDRIVAGCVEAVGPMPRDGVASAFAFGEAFGAIKGCLAAAHVPFELVAPARWKREFGLGGKRGTDAADDARAIVSQIVPRHADLFRRKKDHNRADAALLAIYCARNFRA